MKAAQLHPQEKKRLDALLNYEVLDTEDEVAFDELTELASNICGTSISLISLVDDHRQWFKSKVGLDAEQTDKNIAFCSHAILQDDVFEVPNALEDIRFSDNPLVTGAPDIRFYAGAPLRNKDGLPIGTLCVIDSKPKKLTSDQQRALMVLSKQVISQLELRLNNRRLERMNKQREQFLGVLAHDLRSPFNVILGFARRLNKKANSINPEQLADIASSILGSSLTLYKLLDELLQWSQARLGATQCDMQACDVIPAIEDSLMLVRDAGEYKNIEVELHAPQSLLVQGDVALIKTVLRNLLANAIKYSPADSVVHLSVETDAQYARFIVADSGEGIPDNLRESLFSGAVTSLDGTEGESGHGLGLSLSYEFAIMQGGRLWIDDEYTQGARLIFELQLAS